MITKSGGRGLIRDFRVGFPSFGASLLHGVSIVTKLSAEPDRNPYHDPMTNRRFFSLFTCVDQQTLVPKIGTNLVYSQPLQIACLSAGSGHAIQTGSAGVVLNVRRFGSTGAVFSTGTRKSATSVAIRIIRSGGHSPSTVD